MCHDDCALAYLEMFARFQRSRWSHWGNESDLNGQQIKLHPMYRGNGSPRERLARTAVEGPALWK